MASEFTLYIGYRHVSSWSLRAWMAMRKAGVPFEERMIRYRRPEDKAELVAASPTGKVPLLVHRRGREEIKVWESLSIGEYLAEFFHSRAIHPSHHRSRKQFTTYVESLTTSSGPGWALTASKAAVISMRWLVVWGSAPLA